MLDIFLLDRIDLTWAILSVPFTRFIIKQNCSAVCFLFLPQARISESPSRGHGGGGASGAKSGNVIDAFVKDTRTDVVTEDQLRSKKNVDAF